jgi:hypothetical protein
MIEEEFRLAEGENSLEGARDRPSDRLSLQSLWPLS